MIEGILVFFTDPILRAPTIGSMLMCFSAAVVGVIAFLRKQSLMGEALSHASYPGVILSALVLSALEVSQTDTKMISVVVLCGAFLTGLLSLYVIRFLTDRMKVKSDAALCFVLSAFFGIGLTLASRLQFTHTNFYRKVLIYLYGQAATMVDFHIVMYLILSVVVVGLAAFFYKELKVISFDKEYARSLGIQTKVIDTFTLVLIVLAVVVGIRSVGVVLMSAMLIAPAVSARQFTNKLSTMLILAGIFGALSGFLGNVLSVEVTNLLTSPERGYRLTLPTGPMIVIVSTTICLLSLLFAPERGVVLRLARIARFRYQSLCENILKSIWRLGPEKELSIADIKQVQTIHKHYLRYLLLQLQGYGWIERIGRNHLKLTDEGRKKAEKIVRFHRLWEVYLADYLGVGAERVHCSAEEMEHVITPELEEELTLMLHDPKFDPHHQPIPPKAADE